VREGVDAWRADSVGPPILVPNSVTGQSVDGAATAVRGFRRLMFILPIASALGTLPSPAL